MSPGVRVTIEIEPDEPIHGRIVDGAGAAHAFRGWLELSAALERARQRSGPAAETTAPADADE
jgi:hypothetical protein